MGKFLDKKGVETFWSKIKESLNKKIDKVTGKGLSTNDFTNDNLNQLNRIGGVISVTQLDSLVTNVTNAKALARIVNNKTLRYIVHDNNLVVGTLDMISDNMCHQITQILTSHYIDGTLSTHVDNHMVTLYRSFNISAPSSATAPVGEWSEWKEAIPYNFTKFGSEIRESIKKDLFIDLWKTACGSYGTYNTASGYFELNGLTDITYEQALAIYNAGAITSPDMSGRYKCAKIRTNLPIKMGLGHPSDGYINTAFAFTGQDVMRDSTIEVLNLDALYNNGWEFVLGDIPNTYTVFGSMGTCYLTKIIGTINLGLYKGVTNHLFPKCDKLTTVNLKGLASDLNISDCVKLNASSLTYLCNNRKGTNPITVTVHSVILTLLNNSTASSAWGQLKSLATSKSITFKKA